MKHYETLCLLEMSETIIMKSSKNDWLNMSRTRTAPIDKLMWLGKKISVGLNGCWEQEE